MTALRYIINAWAIVGGFVLTAVVGVNVMSIIGGVFGSPLAGDFEITEVLVAVCVFTFLPYCQLHHKNVTVDIFTTKASPFCIALLQVVASAIALLFAAVLLWRMGYGMVDMRVYGYTTAILQIKHWWAFVPILMSLLLLCVACCMSLIQHVKQMTPAQF